MAIHIPLVMDYNRDDAVQQRLRELHATKTATDYAVTLPGSPSRTWSFRLVVTKWAVDPGPIGGVPQLTVVLST